MARTRTHEDDLAGRVCDLARLAPDTRVRDDDVHAAMDVHSMLEQRQHRRREPTSATQALPVPPVASTIVTVSSISLLPRALHTTAAPACA